MQNLLLRQSLRKTGVHLQMWLLLIECRMKYVLKCIAAPRHHQQHEFQGHFISSLSSIHQKQQLRLNFFLSMSGQHSGHTITGRCRVGHEKRKIAMNQGRIRKRADLLQNLFLYSSFRKALIISHFQTRRLHTFSYFIHLPLLQ